MKIKIMQATNDHEILRTYQAMSCLRKFSNKEDYLSRVKQIFNSDGYKLYFAEYEDNVVSVMGFKICENIGFGRYLYIEDFSTNEKDRSMGYGAEFFDWVVDYAKNEGCDQVRLESATFRNRAHRFYILKDMDISCFHFSLLLTDKIPDDVVNVG